MVMLDSSITRLKAPESQEGRKEGDFRPGPKGFALLGALRRMRTDPLGYFTETLRNYGDVAWFNIGLDRIVMLSDPGDIKHVLQDNHRNYRKSKFYRPLRPLLGGGIFLAEGDDWLAQRRTSTPAFSGFRFEHMAGEIASATTGMLKRWEALADEPLDIAHEMMRLTLDGVTRALFGLNLEDEHDDFYGAIEVVLKEAERRVWSTGIIPPAIFVGRQRAYRRALRIMDDVIERLIERRRHDSAESGDLLAMLIDAYDGSAVEARRLLRDQVISFLVAGHETTAISLSWTWYLLSKHPAAAARFHEEVDSVLQGRIPTFADIKNLTYTGMVLEEAMRLYPPVWTISREATSDDVTAGTRIPKGTTVMLCPYVVHRNPKLWKNPDEFDPDRFAPQVADQTPRHAYFPFGGGPRVCLGKRFAMMEGVLIMAMIGQRYRLDLLPGAEIELEPMITLRPRGGMPVTLKRRTDGPPQAR